MYDCMIKLNGIDHWFKYDPGIDMFYINDKSFETLYELMSYLLDKG